MRRRRRPLALAAAAALALAAGLETSGALERAEEQSIDARFALRGTPGPPAGVVVVGVDERTLDVTEQRWPFARDEQAKLIDRLHAARPRLIVYDIALSEPSDSEEADVAVFEAIARARPMLLAATESDEQGRTPVLGGDENVAAAGAHVGSSLFPRDHGVIRRIQTDVGRVPALSVQAVRLAGGEPPIAPGDSAWIDFAGPAGTVRTHSWNDVATGRTPASALRGKIVVVGTTARRLQDRHQTSVSGDSMPGPEIQANAIATLMRGAPLRSAAPGLDAALVAIAALLVPLVALRFGLPSILTLALAIPVLGAGAQLAFTSGRIVAVASPLAALLLGAGATAVALAATELRDRRRLRETFARFVPPEIVDALAEEAAETDGLPAQQLDATVMFCDLRGFTTFAEGRPPGEVLATLNRYLGGVSDAVLGHGGTVVAFLGDGVMSVFGAPVASDDHADRALAAAREVAGPRLEALNAATGAGFSLGVGLHSGPVMSGTVGSRRRMEYAAIGDTTNVSARVQALTKEHDAAILLTAATQERLVAADGIREVGEVRIRGRDQPARLFAATS